ncbi:MAG: formate--phosphoribosylaminoimidazolecarboxamide ligase [Candidatus Nezhaarchaeota archaeon]|nr:formate--phosphoribosylaminoimidazolecarboxamide ligase [Candidatus Nezhaarchaeota archaeon]
MITREEIAQLIAKYDLRRLAIGTIGSHSALSIFKGAKEEGFRTVCVCRERDVIVYRKFPLADELVIVDGFTELLDDEVQEKLRELNTILIPHGSFTAYLSMEELTDRLYVPMFGNRELLKWEVDREKQAEWLRRAGLRLPKIFKRPSDISGLAIVKLPGARGGRGYFLASSPEDFYRKAGEMVSRGLITEDDVERVQIQEYVLGANVYLHYFSSTMNDAVEFLGVDKRYESTVDAIGRVPAAEQLKIGLSPTYTVVGNIPLTIRESLLPEVLRMGDDVQRVAKELAPPGIIGPFCLETVITDSLEIYTFEISARIVAGMNVWIDTSPYTYLRYGEGMWAGRRIAREVRQAVEHDKLGEVVY